MPLTAPITMDCTTKILAAPICLRAVPRFEVFLPELCSAHHAGGIFSVATRRWSLTVISFWGLRIKVPSPETIMEVEHGPPEDHFPLQTGGSPFPCLARRGCILHGFVLFQREAHQFDPVFGRTNTSQTHCLGGFSLLKLQATVLVVGDFETSLSFSFLFYRNIRSLYSVPVTDMNQ